MRALGHKLLGEGFGAGFWARRDTQMTIYYELLKITLTAIP
jgi:hypothetical protein